MGIKRVAAFLGLILSLAPGAALADGYLLVMGGFSDQEKRAAYMAALPPIYQAHGGAYLALGGPGRGLEQLSGEMTARGMVISHFPSPEAVKSFWTSPAYRDAVRIREGGGSFDVLRLDGEAPGPAGSRKAYLLQLLNIEAPKLPALAIEGAGRVLVDGAPLETLEGGVSPTRVLILEFPSQDALQAWWNGPGGFALAGRAQGRKTAIFSIAGFAPRS
jgi:uncharacterized protein (DUF1330 family)